MNSGPRPCPSASQGARGANRKGKTGSALMRSLQISCFFDSGTFWVLPSTYFYLSKSARAYLFPQSVKIHYFCSGPISVDPICPQSMDLIFLRSDGTPFGSQWPGPFFWTPSFCERTAPNDRNKTQTMNKHNQTSNVFLEN